MKGRHQIGWLVLLALLAPAAWAGEADPMARLDQALKAAATYDYGNDSGPLATIGQITIASATDPKEREAVEGRLDAALAGPATPATKSYICRQLRTIGTARSVPALEALLTDAGLSHMARFALERIEDPAAADALYRALGKTAGKLQVGVINSLGRRRVEKALPDFARLLGSQDAMVAEAAASALGELGGAGAAKALEAARTEAKGTLRQRIDAALLASADQFLAGGQTAEATRLYEVFYAPTEPKFLRIAALRGLAAAQGQDALTLLVAAIRSPDPELQAIAIGFTPSLKGQAATKALADLLPALAPEAQELLVGALAERGDAATAPAIVAATKSDQEAVRVAALDALGSVGNASNVDLLLQAAATAGGNEQQAARASLARLRGEDVNRALLQSIGSGDPKVRVERLRALAARGAAESFDEVLKAARDDDASVRRDAIAALGTLAGEAQLGSLVDLAMKPKEAGDRGAIEQAIANVFRRIADADKQAAPVLAAYAAAPADAKPALLRLLGRAATPKALDAVRAALKDPDAAVQDAAVRTLADWPDATPAEDLLALVRASASPVHKVLALRGYVRMAGLSKDPTAMYVRAMELAQRPEDKKLVLGGLGTAGSADALKLVLQYVPDEQLQAEAASAAIQIADRLRATDANQAKAALQGILAVVKDPAVRQKAQEVFNDMDRYSAHILKWLVTGPYMTKDPGALFDTVFPPEQPDAKDVEWKPLTKGIGSWDIRLDAAVGGENRVAYLRTSVESPVDQDARLELGSDDGIKVWLNGKVVHANNVDRGLEARQDLVKVKLQKGWNQLLLKVTNHGDGWGASCRIRKPDGGPLEGLTVEAK